MQKNVPLFSFLARLLQYIVVTIIIKIEMKQETKEKVETILSAIFCILTWALFISLVVVAFTEYL